MGYTDLHLHFDGSLPLEAVKVLSWLDSAAEIELPYEDDELRNLFSVAGCSEYERKKSLSEYLKRFDLPIKLLQTEENLRFAISQLARHLYKIGVDYAEIRFAPQLHTTRGLTQLQVVQAVIDGYLDRLDFSGDNKDSAHLLSKLIEYEDVTGVNLGAREELHYPHIRFILCLMRGSVNNEKLYEANMETVEVARHFMSEGNSLVAGIDLAGAEAAFPTEDFKDFFGMARKYKIPYTIHAGEAAGPESIWQALEMGARRIGHGVSAVKDESLMQELARKNIVLEMCPTSNLQTGAVRDINEYPLRLFLQHDMKITINSDNMTVSGTDVVQEFDLLKKKIWLSDDEERILKKNAEEAHL